MSFQLFFPKIPTKEEILAMNRAERAAKKAVAESKRQMGIFDSPKKQAVIKTMNETVVAEDLPWE